MDGDDALPRVASGDTWSYTLDTGPAHAGAQGEVFFGTRSDGTPIAVKVGGVGASAQGLMHEIGSLRALASAGIRGVVPVLDVVDVDGMPGMVMPRYRDTLLEWLQKVIHQPDASTLDAILRKSATIARILGGVHRTRWGGDTLLHRDVKPENLFLDEQGRVVLGDFGGAMGISGLQAVELALFGSPMYAPLDQILPGRAIPDATWDTYALCVILYMALTGARPAYQSDPRSLLTKQGRELWAVAQEAIHAEGGQAQRLRLRFAQERVGTTAADLIDPTGKSALNTHDRELLFERVGSLAAAAGCPEGNRRRLQQGLWQILTRGLSPVSHPSPPNRYREAEVLAEQLEDLRDLLHPAPAPTSQRTPVPSPAPEEGIVPPRRRAGSAWLVGMMLAASVLLLGVAGAAIVLRYPPDTWFADQQRVSIPTQTVSLTFESAPQAIERLQGAQALVRITDLPDPSAAERVGVLLEAPVREASLLALDADGSPLERLDLGPRPVGEHMVAWTPPETSVRLVARVDPEGSPVHALAEGALHVDASGTLSLGGGALAPEAVLAWTGPVEVSPFEIDRTEVSLGRWQACVREGACAELEAEGSDRPAVGVTFAEAQAFCAFAGGELPSEAQWRAAHGTARYPWGEERPTCLHAHGAGCADTVRPVGLLPQGASPHGVLDMAGNAWEWVRGETGEGAPLLVGGSVETRGATLGATARQRVSGRTRLAGLRCAYPAGTGP